MLGVLNVNKPVGPTSRDVVSRVSWLVRHGLGVKKFKVGHAGTLDPLADGVLGVCLGRATRLIDYLQAGRKEYRATFAFGVTSDSLDGETETRPVPGGERVSAAAIRDALPRFVGTIEQAPPAFSAVRVGGRRAFDLARAGRSVEPAPRPVVIDQFELVNFDGDATPPRGTFQIVCGAGTYIRSLARDLASAVGTGGMMTALTRTAVGPLGVDEAVPFEELSFDRIREALAPPEAALAALPAVTLDAASADRFADGAVVPAVAAAEISDRSARVAVFDPGRKLLGVGRFDPDSGATAPLVVLYPGNAR